MKVLVVQLNLTIGNLKENTKKIIQAIENGRKKGCDIILFPELTICGYPPEDFLFHKNFIDSMEDCLDQIAKSSQGLMVVVGCVRKNLGKGEKPLFNSAAIIQNGKVIGYQDKWLLPTYDVFDERRYFEPGTSTGVWEYKNKKIGIIICEDIWQHAGYVDYTNYHRDPVLEIKKHQPDLLLNLSASPYQYQKPDTRVKVCSKASNTLNCPVILCCQVGGNDELVFDGYSVYVDKNGNLAQLAHGFKEDEMLVDLDKEPSSCPLLYDPLGDLYSALVLGVRDYFHKSGFTKGCLGLSGGIDSALVACIAVEALGRENVLGIAMPSRYSSESSLTDARDLAKNLNISFEEVSIEKPFQAFLDTLDPYFAGKAADITEENEQARIRGTILMAFSNKFGYVVLSTGNKSEMAMGYCTLYGDMCGGLSVIADVTKEQVYALARYVNRFKELIPVSSIEKPPSAELRPNQKDTDSLPEYDIVDKVLKSYVEDYLSAEQIANAHNISLALVEDLIKKIHRSEYKRRQSAPAIRVSRKAFRAGRKYPIVQGWI